MTAPRSILQTFARRLAFAKRLGPTEAVWRRRVAAAAGAVLVGLVALAFAGLADIVQGGFAAVERQAVWIGLLAPPLGLAVIVYLTRRLAPAAKGSGIPQVIAAARAPETGVPTGFVSMRTGVSKLMLTLSSLAVGASVGREGPTVQIGASLMTATHRLLRVPLTPGVLIAGGAAGVSAAFNTPLAGVTFAIEELASAYEQRVTVLVMASVVIAGMVSLGIAGDYLYFGGVRAALSLQSALLIAPVAGVAGGLTGGLFSRAMLAMSRPGGRLGALTAGRPILWAALCGLAVAAVGLATSGATWGTSYEAARGLVEGRDMSPWFGPAKFAASLATSASGAPGGIFAPSLAAGAGLGDAIAFLFPNEPRGAVVLLGMIGYFVGVVRAPLTGVVIVSEMTGARGLILPLFAAAILADAAGALVCRERLYHGLSIRLAPAAR